MTAEQLAFLRAIAADPTDGTARLVYADWLDDHGRGAQAAIIRGSETTAPRDWPPPKSVTTDDARVACAEYLEREHGCVGLAVFARTQCLLHGSHGLRHAEFHDQIEWEYAELLRRWRTWLPASVTLLKRAADREAYNRDYRYPAIHFPTRRRGGFRTGHERPSMCVHFIRGLPAKVECWRVDWERSGVDLLERFPWIAVVNDPFDIE